jgi:hypothetical protein
MEASVTVSKVFTFQSAEGSIHRLKEATAQSEGMLPRSALLTLIQLTAMAHPTGAEGDIVSAAFPAADLDRLVFLKYIRPERSSVIELA